MSLDVHGLWPLRPEPEPRLEDLRFVLRLNGSYLQPRSNSQY
jgi:hypothetical protein